MANEFLPIDDYGVIGNDDRCALVGVDGSIDWCSFPHVESPSVFAAILDPDVGGRFAVRPAETYESSHEYIDRTNVLKTTFETDTGTLALTDFMPIRQGPPPGEGFQQALYRKVAVVSGAVDVEVVFEPRFEYARSPTTIERAENDTIVATPASDGRGDGDQTTGQNPAPEDDRVHDHEHGLLALHTDLDCDVNATDVVARTTVPLEAGATQWLCLQYGSVERCADREYDDVLDETIDYWRTWLKNCEESACDLFAFDPEWRAVLVRSALVLKLLIHDETGSIPAAPTTSLPEEIGGELNWDYRYNWIRDAKFTIQALYSVGQSAEARKYFEWFRDIGHETPAEIQPLYGLHSEVDLDEECLDHLSGYRDSTPVRIGNAAAKQEQLDIYGTIVQGIYETVRYEEGLTDYDWESVRALAAYVCEHWDERDKSLWEFRDLHEHFVHSKLLCWVALDRAIRLAETYDRTGPIDRWKRERGAIRNAIEDRGYNEEVGSFVQFFDAEEALDATALLLPIYDFLPADDDRVQETIDTILDELTTDDGLVYRFTNSPARPREPGGFILCSCWLVDALVLSGRLEEATEIFDQLREHTSSLGLLSEMIHEDGETFLGNFPQAFSHIGLLNSAIYLASASETAEFPPEELSTGAGVPLFRRHDS